MSEIRVDDAVHPANSRVWGIYRVRAVEGERVFVQADEWAAWVPRSSVVYAHTPARWIDMILPVIP